MDVAIVSSLSRRNLDGPLAASRSRGWAEFLRQLRRAPAVPLVGNSQLLQLGVIALV